MSLTNQLSEAINRVTELLDAEEERSLTPSEREELEEYDAIIGDILRMAFRVDGGPTT